jgi:septal ring factor EnvC (AmiA/AmiB activator)
MFVFVDIFLHSISWEYNVAGELSLDDYENSRPARRSHFEMVLPRKVRHDMLRKEWDIRQKDIAEAVRRNIKVKNQRKSTVNNLNKATKLEEAMESLSRKLKRLATFQKPVSAQVKYLDQQMEKVMRQRSKLRLDIQMAQEYDEDVASTEENSSS